MYLEGCVEKVSLQFPPFPQNSPTKNSMEKKSFVCYTDWYENIECMSQDQKWNLLDARFQWQIWNVEIALWPLESMAYNFICQSFKRDKEKWETEIEMRRNAGKLGGLAKSSKAKQNVANVARARSARKIVANVADSVSVTEPVSVSVTNLNSTIVESEQALKPDNRNQDVQTLIYHIKEYCKSRSMIYDSTDDRNFARHISTAKDFWEISDSIGKTRAETAIAIMELAEMDKFWRGKVCWPKSIYQNRAKILNNGRATFMNQTQNPDVLVI